MLPSLSRLSLTASSVAVHPRGEQPPPSKRSMAGSDQPLGGTSSLLELPEDAYIHIISSLMQGAPSQACEAMLRLCSVSQGACDDRAPSARRESLYKAACLALFGVVNAGRLDPGNSKSETDRDVVRLFKTWKNLFQLLCAGFSPNKHATMRWVWGGMVGLDAQPPNPWYPLPEDAMDDDAAAGVDDVQLPMRKAPPTWTRYHAELLGHRPDSLPQQTRLATKRRLDTILVRFLHACGTTSPAFRQLLLVRQQGPYESIRLAQVYTDVWDSLQIGTDSHRQPTSAIGWLLFNRGGRIYRSIPPPVPDYLKPLRPVPDHLRSLGQLLGPWPVEDYYGYLDDEIFELLAGHDKKSIQEVDLSVLTKKIKTLIGLGGEIDGFIGGREYLDAQDERSQSVLNELLMLNGGEHGALFRPIVEWLWSAGPGRRDDEENVPFLQLRPAFGAVISRARLRTSEWDMSTDFWTRLVASAYQTRYQQFSQSIQLRSIFLHLLGDIEEVMLYLQEDGPIGPVSSELYFELTTLDRIEANTDVEDTDGDPGSDLWNPLMGEYPIGYSSISEYPILRPVRHLMRRIMKHGLPENRELRKLADRPGTHPAKFPCEEPALRASAIDWQLAANSGAESESSTRGRWIE